MPLWLAGRVNSVVVEGRVDSSGLISLSLGLYLFVLHVQRGHLLPPLGCASRLRLVSEKTIDSDVSEDKQRFTSAGFA